MEPTLFGKMKQELVSPLFWRAGAAEFVGTCLFIFIHHGATSIFPDRDLSELRNAFAAGFAIATFVLCTSHISGGHFNPAVSLSFLGFGFITPLRAVVYMIAQLGGATLGAFLIWVATPYEYNLTVAATVLGPGITQGQGLLIEIVLTFQLVFMIFAVVDENRTDIVGSKPLAIGLSVVIGILCGINYTGASMNPARSFSSALVSGTWRDHWIYWVGPFIGGPLGAMTYRWILDPSGTMERFRNDATCSCAFAGRSKNRKSGREQNANQTEEREKDAVDNL